MIILLLLCSFNCLYAIERTVDGEDIVYTNVYKLNANGEMISSEMVEDIFAEIIRYYANNKEISFEERSINFYSNVYFEVEQWEKNKNGMFYVKKIRAYNMKNFFIEGDKKETGWYNNSNWKVFPAVFSRKYQINQNSELELSISRKNDLTEEQAEFIYSIVGNSNLAGMTYFFIPLMKNKEDRVLQYGTGMMTF